MYWLETQKREQVVEQTCFAVSSCGWWEMQTTDRCRSRFTVASSLSSLVPSAGQQCRGFQFAGWARAVDHFHDRPVAAQFCRRHIFLVEEGHLGGLSPCRLHVSSAVGRLWLRSTWACGMWIIAGKKLGHCSYFSWAGGCWRRNVPVLRRLNVVAASRHGPGAKQTSQVGNETRMMWAWEDQGVCEALALGCGCRAGLGGWAQRGTKLHRVLEEVQLGFCDVVSGIGPETA